MEARACQLYCLSPSRHSLSAFVLLDGGRDSRGRCRGAAPDVVDVGGKLDLRQPLQLRHRPEDREGSVLGRVSRNLEGRRKAGGAQEGPDLRDDGRQGQARLHEGDPAVAGDFIIKLSILNS